MRNCYRPRRRAQRDRAERKGHAGREYWSRRPPHSYGAEPGRYTKTRTHRLERRAAAREIREEVGEVSETTVVPYRPAGEFGWTNDSAVIEAVRQYVAAAVADGWTIRPTYQHESVGRAAKLERDGFVALALMRDHRGDPLYDGKWAYEATLHLWGPDKLAIRPPEVYDWDRIVAGLRRCGDCGAEDVDVYAVGFAGRVCAACLPAARKRLEYPGWCD